MTGRVFTAGAGVLAADEPAGAIKGEPSWQKV
jgi:hypothetical protein